MSKQSPLWRFERTIPSELVAGKAILDEILDRLRDSSWDEEEVFCVHLSLEEAIVNAIKHGNRWDQSKQVRVLCELSSARLLVEIEDEGTGFDPNQVPDCTEEDNLDVPSGRGIMLMRSFMSRVEYNDLGNRVVMCKERGLAG